MGAAFRQQDKKIPADRPYEEVRIQTPLVCR